MTYYSINPSLDKKVLGRYPQVEDIHHNCHIWDEPKFIEHLHFKEADFEPITSSAIIHPKAFVTDLISVEGMGFSLKLLISGKLKRLLEENRRSGLQFFRSPIVYQNVEIQDFWVINFFETNMEYVDYEKSKIFKRSSKPEGGTLLTGLEVPSQTEFQALIDTAQDDEQIYIDGIILHKDIRDDFFLLKNVRGGVKYVVSEKLKWQIEEAGCTGIEFQPIELSLNEWLMPGGERERVYGKS